MWKVENYFNRNTNPKNKCTEKSTNKHTTNDTTNQNSIKNKSIWVSKVSMCSSVYSIFEHISLIVNGRESNSGLSNVKQSMLSRLNGGLIDVELISTS